MAKAVVREEVLNGHLGNLRHRKLSLGSIGSANDVRQRHPSRSRLGSGGRSLLELTLLKMRLHRGQCRCCVVLKRQVPETRELIARERSQTRRMSGSGDRGVVGSR